MTKAAPPTVAETEDTEFQTKRLVTISAGHAVHDTYSAFLAPLLPRLEEKLSLSNTSAALLSVFLRVPSLFQPVIGQLADKTALRWIVILGPGATATAMSLLGWRPGYLGLALLLMLAGVSGRRVPLNRTRCRQLSLR